MNGSRFRAIARDALLVAATVGAIAWSRPRAADTVRRVKAVAPVYTLPPASAMPALSFGYRAALADLIFTSAKVGYGIANEERHRFDVVGDYLDAVIALDPRFRDAYRFADTMLIFQAVGNPPEENIRHARRIMQQGVEQLPGDPFLWVAYGQFLAFLAPQFLSDPKEREEYKLAGSRVLLKAGEVQGMNGNLPWHALGGIRYLREGGEGAIAIAALEKMLAVTDDPALRESILAQLDRLEAKGKHERQKRLVEAFDGVWLADLPNALRTTMLVVGPKWDVGACAGNASLPDPDGQIDPSCATSWKDWLTTLPE